VLGAGSFDTDLRGFSALSEMTIIFGRRGGLATCDVRRSRKRERRIAMCLWTYDHLRP